ncbi:MAG: hypothetical protein ACPL1Y_07055 [Thermoplasmata archaeon]
MVEVLETRGAQEQFVLLVVSIPVVGFAGQGVGMVVEKKLAEVEEVLVVACIWVVKVLVGEVLAELVVEQRVGVEE